MNISHFWILLLTKKNIANTSARGMLTGKVLPGGLGQPLDMMHIVEHEEDSNSLGSLSGK